MITVEVVEGSPGTESLEITLSDGLENVRFNQPLTILFDQPTDWVGRPFTVSQDGELLDEFVFDTGAVALSLEPNERPYRFARALSRQVRSTANAATLRSWRLNSTPIKWMGSPRWRYLSA